MLLRCFVFETGGGLTEGENFGEFGLRITEDSVVVGFVDEGVCPPAEFLEVGVRLLENLIEVLPGVDEIGEVLAYVRLLSVCGPVYFGRFDQVEVGISGNTVDGADDL